MIVGINVSSDPGSPIPRVPDLDHVLSRVPDRALAIDRALALAFHCARARARELNRGMHLPDRDRALDLDLKLDRALDRARTLDRAFNFTDLETALTGLIIPKNSFKLGEWRTFTEALKAIMIQHRDIGHPLELTHEETKHLTHYLNATRLLKDCLELATMPLEKKEEILESLFLPPA